MLPLKKNPKKKVKVIIPKPPSWIRNKIIPLPRLVNAVAVSTTISPVTQTALVDVKKASIMLMPFVVAFGNSSNAVPIKIRKMKLPTIIIAGLSVGRSIEMLLRENSIIKTRAVARCEKAGFFKKNNQGMLFSTHEGKNVLIELRAKRNRIIAISETTILNPLLKLNEIKNRANMRKKKEGIIILKTPSAKYLT